MRRRSRAGGTSAKSQRRKATMLKRRNASKAKRNRAASIAGQETVVARLTPERDEALLRMRGAAIVPVPFLFAPVTRGRRLVV